MFGNAAFSQAPFASLGVKTTLQALAASVTSTVSISKLVGKLMSVSSTSTATVSRAISKLITYSESTTNTVSKTINRLFSLSASSTSAATLVKSVGVVRLVVTSSTVSFVRAVRKIVNAGADTVIVVLSDIAKHLVSISYATTTTSSLSKAIRKTISAVSSTSAYLYLGYRRTLAVASTSVAAMSRAVRVVRSVTSTTTNTIVHAAIVFKSLVVTAVSTATVVKSIVKTVFFTSLTSSSTLNTIANHLVLLVTSVYTTVVLRFHTLVYNVKDTIFVPTRKVAMKIVGFTSILVRPKKTSVVASKQDNLDG